jgi:hypothetical protein
MMGKQTTVATVTAEQATTSTATSPAGLGITLMAHHANSQNRKEQCDSSDNRAIHRTILQIEPLQPAADT